MLCLFSLDLSYKVCWKHGRCCLLAFTEEVLTSKNPHRFRSGGANRLRTWCPLKTEAWSHACHQLLAGGWSTASFRSCFFLKFTLNKKKQAQKVPPAYESKGVEWAYAAYAYAKNWSGCKNKLFTTQCNLTTLLAASLWRGICCCPGMTGKKKPKAWRGLGL